MIPLELVLVLVSGFTGAVGLLWREDRRVYRERIDDLKTTRDSNGAGWATQSEANLALTGEVTGLRAEVAGVRAELAALRGTK